MCTIILGHKTGDQLAIHVLSYTYPDSNDKWDGNWLNATIEITSGAFRGATETRLRTDEFERFLQELELLSSSLKGSAEYNSMEEWLSIKITGDGMGHLSAQGRIIDKHSDGNELKYLIQFDQTGLPQLLSGLKKLMATFPVRGT